MAADGITRAACFVTSAYSSYSSCRQYRENLFDAVEGVENAPHLDKLALLQPPRLRGAGGRRHPTALAELPDAVRDGAHLVFVTHSIPLSMNEGSGPDGDAYVAQHRSVATEVVERVRQETGRRHAHELVYCSRSGAAHIPWLEPDINDHLERLSDRGASSVVMVPVGFVSDHMEVIYDLDTEAVATAEKLELPAARAATPGVDPRFVSVVRDLLLERARVERGGDAVRGRRREHRAAVGPLPGRLLPEPARPAPGPVRVGSVSEELAGIALDVAPPPSWSADAPAVAVADTKTSDTDVVTEADRASETLIRRLRERRPDDAFLGEEGAEEAGTSGVRWIVDPIDGTVNFLYGPGVRRVDRRRARRRRGGRRGPQRGHGHGVRRPPRRRRRRGGGVATRDGIPIGVRAPAPLSHRLVATGSSYDPRVRELQARAMVFLPRIRDIRRIGSSAWTCATSARARSTPTSRRASTTGTTRPAGWWPGSQGPAPS